MRKIIVTLICIMLAACTSTGKKIHKKRYAQDQDGPPLYHVDVSKIPNAVPKAEPRSRYGNPSSYVVGGRRYHVMSSSKGYRNRGIASWYGTKFHSYRTSSGEPYDMFGMTAAHPTLPIPTYVQVTNLQNGRTVIVKVNDRGPFRKDRLLDLSYAAAKKLGVTGAGSAMVEVKAITPGDDTPPPQLVETYTPPAPSTVIYKTSATETKQIYLQLGAFSQAENAEHLAEQIRALVEHPINIQRNFVGAQALYRVQIGPLVNSQQQNHVHQTISQAGLGNPIVIVQ